jgi:hypothetical protein
MMGKRFRVAFSFAGEKRSFVSSVADILAGQFGRDVILYDKYHESEFSVGNLALCLPMLYKEQADLVVVVFSEEYSKNEWCGLEWRAIYGLFKEKCDSAVMLSRFDHFEPEGTYGLYGLPGYYDLDQKTPEQFAGMIRERLALNEGKPSDFYKNTSEGGTEADDDSNAPWLWPMIADTLLQSVANHKKPQRAFKDLLRGEAPFQVLLIQGDSETGKTHLSKQFIRAVHRSPPMLRCGRFDFKGSTDMDVEVDNFSDQLNLAHPTPGSLVRRLAQILTGLRENPCPTMLIFDTFEVAGSAEEWVRNMLLLAMMRLPWLRIVISGQRTITSTGEPWESYSSELIQLRRPTPEEWWEYGICSEPDLKLEYVRWAYAKSRGKSSTLAGLLAPHRCVDSHGH